MALIGFNFNATAQQGSFYVGASNIGVNHDGNYIGTGVSFISTGDNKTTLYGFAPELGYYVSDRVAIGGIIGISGSSIKDTKDKSFNFGISPYVRYFLHQGDNFGFYLQGGVDFLQEKSEDTYKGESTTTTWGVGLLPGVSYALSSHFSVLASFGTLGYTSNEVKETGADNRTNNTFGLNLDASTLKFSLRYTF